MSTRNILTRTLLSLILLGASGMAAATQIALDATAVGGFGAGPYGWVTMTESAGNVDFTVDLRSDLNFVNTGNENSHSVFSFNANDVVAADITNVLFNGSANADYSIISPGHNSPFGEFDFAFFCTGSGCSNGAGGQQTDPLTFTVQNANIADFMLLSTGGSPNAYFAADVICNGDTCNGLTGAIGATGKPRDVPEPSTLALLGLGLIALSLSLFRRRQAGSI